MLAGDLGAFDQVLARLPGPDFGRIREQAVRGYHQATAGAQDDEEVARP